MTFGLKPSVFIHCMTFYIYIYKGKYMTLDISISMSVFGTNVYLCYLCNLDLFWDIWHHELYMIHCKGPMAFHQTLLT